MLSLRPGLDAEPLRLPALEWRLGRRKRRLLLNLTAWTELLDSLGWCVAYEVEPGAICYSSNALAEFGGQETAPRTLPDLALRLDASAPAARPVNTSELQIWAPKIVDRAPLFASSPLTKREGEVCRWLREGKTAPEIAIILGCATRTVETHTARIYRKLGVTKRIELLTAPRQNESVSTPGG